MMTVTTRTCEIEGCERGSVSAVNGIHVCDRCRLEFASARPWGAVYFGGRWHGVRGATYPRDVADALPGLVAGDEASR